MPVDYRALGFETEGELVEALRAHFGIPDDCSVSVYLETLDGKPALTMVVSVPEWLEYAA